jgi:predicted lipid-binding transport protein (Tim44 family)
MSGIDPMMIFFALLAIFVGWRLWSVLGARTGTERPPMDAPRSPRVGGDIIDMPPRAAPSPSPAADRWVGVAAPGTPLARGLDTVAAGDPSFDPQRFVAGARAAYEMIIAAFAAGDVATLRQLLAPEPLANFTNAIEARNAARQKMTTTLVSLDRADIAEASVQDDTAFVAVKFSAKLNSVTTDASGAVVEGSPTEVHDHEEIWTFARPLTSRDPNWRLNATEATH